MKTVWGRVKTTAMVAVLSLPVVLAGGGSAVPVLAAGPKTSILPANTEVDDILKWIVNFLLYGLGAVAVIGVVIAGIMYLTARDNEQQVAKAKKRLLEISIGLVAWAMLFTLLQWLIPGFDPKTDLK